MQKDLQIKHPNETYDDIKVRIPETGGSLSAKHEISEHISSLFYFVKMTARAHCLLDIQNDQKLLDLADFAGKVEKICQIGEGLSDALTVCHSAPKQDP